jgi:hypothetical protein
MKKVLDQYVTHGLRLASKKPSDARSKGLAYYTAAGERVQALIDAPTPEWVGLNFGKKSAF